MAGEFADALICTAISACSHGVDLDKAAMSGTLTTHFLSSRPLVALACDLLVAERRIPTQLDRASCLAHDGDGSAAMAQAMEALLPLSDVQREGIITLRARATIVALPPQERVPPAARELRELLSATAETKEIED